MTSADRSSHPPLSRRERLMWIYRVAGPAGAVVLAGALLFLRSPRVAPYAEPVRFATMIAIVVLAMVWGLTFGWLAMRKEDEFTLTGAKFAWFWGGLIGLVCSVPVMAFITWGGLTMIDPVAFRPSREKASALVFGYLLAVGFQYVGYLVVRFSWGARRS